MQQVRQLLSNNTSNMEKTHGSITTYSSPAPDPPAISSIRRHFLWCLKILAAVHRLRSDGLKVEGTCYKEPKLWAGTKY
jgi:hypothetical protein